MEPAPTPPGTRPPYGWLVLLGLLSGAPYGIVTEAYPTIWAAEQAAASATTAFSADVTWPWALKFLVAPFVDRIGSRRAWIFGGAALCSALSVLLACLDPRVVGGPLLPTLVALAVVSAVQDVAIDAYAVEALPSRALGPGNAVRVTAWRVGLLVFGGFLAGRVFGWGTGAAFGVAAVAFGLVALAVATLPSTRQAPGEPVALVAPIRRLAAQRDVLAIAAFVLLFKAGDYAMPGALTKKLLVAREIAPTTIADVLTPLGVGATIGGAAIGGLVTARLGIFRALWILGAFQALSNLAYAGAGWSGSRGALFAAAVFEPFCSGLGTAPFLAFLMACCDRAHAATHFALWSAVMAFGRWLFSRWSGHAAQAVGYEPWFALTFVLALPAYGLLPAVRRRLAAPREPALPPVSDAPTAPA